MRVVAPLSFARRCALTSPISHLTSQSAAFHSLIATVSSADAFA